MADSTALTRPARKSLLKIARANKRPAVVLMFDIDLEECIRRDSLRERPVGPDVIRAQYARFLRAKSDIQAEEWDQIIVVGAGSDSLDNNRVRIGSFDLRDQRGPFDIIGDVHGCADELRELVARLGYQFAGNGDISHPESRRIIVIGDLADRGPKNAEVLKLALRWSRSGALYTPGNHCNKLMRYLEGRKVRLSHGLELTVGDVEATEAREPGFKAELHAFIANAPVYLWLDGGNLVVAHGGIKAGMIGRGDRAVQTMCLYGDITGKSNPDGTPERLDWAAHYRGSAAIVYGHTPTPAPQWRNNTINIDQGCVFGGALTALRWPEREILQVEAHAVYDPSKDMDSI